LDIKKLIYHRGGAEDAEKEQRDLTAKNAKNTKVFLWSL